jgi:CRP-like cAMP-binding protein
LHTDEESSEPQVIALLGKGDFFGEAAVLGNRPHDGCVRARTAVPVVQIGIALFSQIAGSFAPLREVLSRAVSEPIATLMDPLPKPLLRFEGIPLLEHVMSGAKQAGIERLLIIVGYQGTMVRRWFAGSRPRSTPVTCVENLYYHKKNRISLLKARLALGRHS